MDFGFLQAIIDSVCSGFEGLEIVGGHHFTASFLLVAMVFQMTLIRIKL